MFLYFFGITALDEDVEQRNLKCALSGAKNKVARMKLYKFMVNFLF